MKRLGLFVSAMCLVAVAVLGTVRSSAGQANSGDRVAALETQVADLEATVASREGMPSASPAATPDGTHALSVSVVITGEAGDAATLLGEGASGTVQCAGLGILADIDGGTPVRIRDVQGALVGRSALGAGKWEPFNPKDNQGYGVCTFDAIPVSVAESPFYTVEVGDHLGFAFSLEEMEHSGWNVYLYATDFMDH